MLSMAALATLLATAPAAAVPKKKPPPKPSPFTAQVRATHQRDEAVDYVVDADEIKRVAGASGDVLRVVQDLPGVARPPFGAGQIVVWGTAPEDTRIYADGVLIPRIYHFGGLRSTVNSEFIQDVSFLPGAYGADYGLGLGGVIDIATRKPRTDRFHATVTMDLFDGSFTLEGPLTAKLSISAAARVSWIAAFLPLFLSGTQLSPFYWDYQITLRYRFSASDDLDLMLFGSEDDVTAGVTDPDPLAQVSITSDSYFSRARLRWIHRFSKDTTFTATPYFGVDTFSLTTGPGGFAGQPLDLQQEEWSYGLRAELRHRASSFCDVAAGLDFEGNHAAVDVLAPIGPPGGNNAGGQIVPIGTLALIQNAATAEGAFIGNTLFSSSSLIGSENAVFDLVQAAPYLIARIKLWDDRLLVSPGVRVAFDYYRSYGGAVSRLLVNLEPRLLVQLQLVPGLLALKAAVGVYHEPPQGAELSRVFGNPNLVEEYGTTYVLGADVQATPALHIEVQGFYKDLRSLIVPDPGFNYTNFGIGRVYGGEVMVRQRLWRGLSGWIAYTLSRSERQDSPQTPWYLYAYDQTHILTLLVNYQLPKGFAVGVRFRYVTGNPTTPVVGGYRDVPDQTYVPVYGAENSARLPDFNQLDLRVDKLFTFKRWKLGLYADLQNIYNEQNTESLVYGGRQLAQVAQVTSLPFFPNVGARVEY